MKIKVVPAFIVIAMAALIAYGFYALGCDENNKVLCIGSGVMSLFMLMATFGVDFKNPRASANIKVLSIVFFAASLISNFIFAFIGFTEPYVAYIIVNGIILLVWLLIANAIGKAKQ